MILRSGVVSKLSQLKNRQGPRLLQCLLAVQQVDQRLECRQLLWLQLPHFAVILLLGNV